MTSIKISPKFFRSEVRNYGSPSFAFWRELSQNSVDAGATKLTVTTEDRGRDILRVILSDNGSGMDRDTLERVFFSLGETTKDGAETMGGFGRARLMLCFAQEAYRIETGFTSVTGSGGDYEISHRPSYLSGTTFAIDVHLPTMSATAESMRAAHLDYLSKCHFSGVEVAIDGTKFSRWLVRGRDAGHLSFGSIYTKKAPQEHGGKLFVRVRGALMFERELATTNSQVIVEIDPECSRDVLVSNRDSLKWQNQNELDELVQKIAVDTKTALKERHGETVEIASGGFRGLVARDLTYCSVRIQSKQIVDRSAWEFGMWAQVSGIRSAAVVPNYRIAQERKHLSTQQAMMRNSDEDEASNQTNDLLTIGMVHVINTNDARIRDAAHKWKQQRLAEHGAGRDRRKLFAQWVIACEYALSALATRLPYSFTLWGPGVIFEGTQEGGRCLAQHRLIDGAHVLLLNPLDEVGKIAYRLRDYAHHIRLLTLACHEASHIVYSCHNEDFSSLFTSLVADTLVAAKDAHQEMLGVE